MANSQEEKRYIQSVDRAMRILTFVADSGSVRLGDVAKHMGLKTSTAFGLLQTLEFSGFVSRSQGGMEYCLGLSSLKLGLCFGSTTALPQTIHTLLVEMTKATGETSYFEMKIGERYYYYDVVLSKNPLKVVPDSDQFIELPSQSAVAQVFDDPTGQIGYAKDIEGTDVGLNCFAAPFRTGDAVIGCVALSGPAGRFTEEKVDRAFDSFQSIMRRLSLERYL
jgi:DNA-binding IclR family transcriptional regulator